MKRFKKWLRDDTMNIVLTAAAIAVIIMVVGFTAATIGEAHRGYGFTTVDGIGMARWHLHGRTYAEYTGRSQGLFQHHLVVTQVPIPFPLLAFPETRVLYFDAEYFSACKYTWTLNRRDRKCGEMSKKELAEMYLLVAQAKLRAANGQASTVQRRLSGDEP